eukprot:TRINITY_DN90151_c0_g1_i1.p3 TRINITY_DN90151_c0_g1~~TRINITY_DN90151_c0_g1_i1.p3  ORF type:complete len:192 (-),score=26.57 TRINITY_DN90151_c0_g1_i1:130-705(-)
MSVPGWKNALLHSLETNKSLVYSKYFQLATIKPNGRPSNRTVVYRGFLGDNISFITDGRSRKVQEIALNPSGEICWYFPNSREQYRISGNLKVVDKMHEDQELVKARQVVWSGLSDNARKQFLWPHPGLPRQQNDEEQYNPQVPSAQTDAVSDFCLVVMEPQDVEHVLLISNQRFCYFKNQESWECQEVNP